MSNFKSKEEHYNFISAWKSATNSEEAKSKKVVCDYSEYRWCHNFSPEEKKHYEDLGFTVSDTKITKKDGSHCKIDGWMNASHYLFRNMMLGKDQKRGFTPITAKRKLPEHDSPWQGFNSASWELQFIVQDAKQNIDQIGQGKKPQSGNRARMFLTPFNGAISIADLATVDVDALEQGRKVHR